MFASKKKILIVCSLVLGIFVVAPIASARTIVPGVDYETQTTSRDKPVRILAINTQQALIRVEGKGTACNTPYRPADINALTEETNFVGAINASFFTGGNVARADYVGNRVHLGREMTNKFVAVDHAGNITNGEGSLEASQAGNYSMYINGIFRLSTNGSNFTTMTEADIRQRFAEIYPANSEDELDRTTGSHNATGAIHRTFMGINPAEHKIFLVVAGGYALTGDHSALGGIVPTEAIEILRRLGSTEGYLLDGGGSSFMRLNTRLTAGDGGSNSDGRGIANLVVVRTGTPQTQAQVEALPRLECGSASGAGTVTGTDTTTTDTTGTTGTTTTAPSTTTTTSTAAPGTVPLEVPIGSITSVSGEGGIIVNYSRILFAFAAGLVGLLALIMLIVSGLRIITGGSDQMTKGKEGIVGAVSGLILFASSGFLLYLINPCFFVFGDSTVCQQRIAGTTAPSPSSTFTGGPAPSGSSTTGGPISATDSPPSDYREHLPSVWGNSKKAEGLDRFNDFGAEFIRQTNIIFPGVPPELIMGFALNGGRFENTTGFRTGLASEHRADPPAGVDCAPVLREGQREFGSASLHQAFHEIGMFGVEGGPRCGPAPGPAGAAHSNWTPVARSSDVQNLLGREGCTSAGCWYPPSGIPDQIAIGLVNTRNAGRSVMGRLPESIRASSENSLWFVSLAFMGWSAGTGRAANHVRQFESELAAVPENQRWGTLLRLLADRANSGQIRCRAHQTHGCVLYSAMRTLQKNEAGLILARERGGNVQFWEDGLGDQRPAILDTITRYGSVAHR